MTTSIALSQKPAQRATHKDSPLITDSNQRTFVTPSRPAQAPAPAPRATVAKPAPSNDPVAAVMRAFARNIGGSLTVSEIIRASGLPRGTVCCTLVSLAADGRMDRHIDEYEGQLIVRWSVRR